MNTLCFIGVFQFLGTYVVSGDRWALIVFVNGVIFHGGCNFWRWPDIIFNCFAITYKIFYASNLFITRVCALIACLVYLLNRRGNSIIHVVGVQYILNIPMISIYPEYLVLCCLLLGTVIACIINGSPRLESGRVASPRITNPKKGVTEPPTPGTGHSRERPRRTYYVSTEDRASGGTGFPEAARPFLGGAAQGLQGRRKGHGRSRSW